MIVDIFHGQQFTINNDTFESRLIRWEIVKKESLNADRIALTMRDTLGTEHTHVFPIQSEAFDMYANAIAPS